MVSPTTRRMTLPQRSTVNAALSSAISEGKRFVDIETVEAHLKDLVAPTLIQDHIREIFDCYLKLSCADLPLSPLSTSEGPNLNSVEPDSSNAENSRAAGLTFVPEGDPFHINIYRPRFDAFGVLTAKYCKGAVSYISAEVVRRHRLTARKGRLVLDWNLIGSERKRAHTRCQISEDEINFIECDIALAEDFEQQDAEEMEEDEESEVAKGQDMATHPVLTEPFSVTTTIDFSPQDDAEVWRVVGEINLATARSFVQTNKRKAGPSSYFSSTAHTIESTQKRAKIS